MKSNHLKVEAYSSGLSLLPDPGGMLRLASEIEFATGYSGGLYLSGSFYVPREITKWWPLAGAQRIAFRDGADIVYDGKLDGFEHISGEGAHQGTRVHLTGVWDAIAQRRRLLKIWSDRRLEDEIWRWQTGATGAEKCEIDRTSRIRFTPKAEAWTSGEYAAVRYSMPAGETIKSIRYDYNFQEGGQAWELAIRNVGTSTDVVCYTASGSGSAATHTFATPTQSVELRLYARANQTPTSDGAYYGEFSNITIYSETSSINLTEIAADIVGAITDINAETGFLNNNTQSVTPFFSANETLADILTGAASFGDSSGNRWAVGFLHAEKATAKDGLPVLFIEQYPALTDYDYDLRLGEECLAGPVRLYQDFSQIWNYITVEYQDENGWSSYITPADEATLTDATSDSAPPTGYGRRDQHINVGYSSYDQALANGVRYLAAHKDPQWVVTQPVSVYWIRKKSREIIPSSHIEAGKRLRIGNFPVGSSGIILRITGTHYDDDNQICSMTFGKPMDPMIQALTPPTRAPVDESPTAGNATGMQRHIYELIGFSKERWMALPEERRRAIKSAAQRAKIRTGRYKRWKEFI